MDKEQSNFPKDFFKQFKSKEDFQSFFSSLYKEGVEEMLKAEMDEHLGYEKHSAEGRNSGNSRNGSYPKKVKTESLGDMVLNIPRDRKSDFEPQLIPKGQRMSDKLEEAIIGMYSRGMTTSDISEQVKEAYGVDVSEGTISNVTNKIIEHVKEWQNRPLEQVYFTVWMDGIVLKVKQNGKYINKCIYLVIGLKKDGIKEILGMWMAETESASFWMSVLTDLKARGVEDILIACTDNLKGFTDAIKGVFPDTVTQLCIVHQIRNSCKYVVWKDRKSFCADLKEVYAAPNRDAAEHALTGLSDKWEHKYKHAISSWKTNWDNLTNYFDYPLELRKIIYTTNTIENVNRGIRKYIKTKVQFTDDMSAQKAVYLALMNIERKWNATMHNWGLVLHQFLTIFESRCRL
ncbi:transposase [Flavobacterium akiainvivens]|uniref:Mutator family transposase n=1 Tax=Flavobacterium akiainvivens TaxID=1202724 RepID=A0A0M9VH93_9FLAO|nr:IS256 family transposase [Flavobacterium akiainvivens]KOS05300.1 transposase [Flavobacterium akiainvivens]SFQ76280.1 Transposase (or an inactivated derivative) [Flavobacterium akiainvivens]